MALLVRNKVQLENNYSLMNFFYKGKSVLFKSLTCFAVACQYLFYLFIFKKIYSHFILCLLVSVRKTVQVFEFLYVQINY